MDIQEREQKIEEAMDLISQAQILVDKAIRGTNMQSHFEAYGRYGFDQLLGNGNPYDGSLLKLVEDGDEGLYSLTDD